MKHLPPAYSPRLTDTTVLAVVALFSLCLLPYVANYVWNHPDERHYTDAAITMTQTGDYLSPRAADGSLRFRKPILTYWIVAASYGALGVSPLSSRLPFVLAGAGVILLTYRLAADVFNRRQVACLAAVIVAAHPVLIMSATRSIPDVFLCLFLLLSVWGFVGMMRDVRPDPRYYWAAYLGCGLAVATKGLPAVAFVAFTWVFLVTNPWRRIPAARLVHLPSMIVAALVGISWFVAASTFHGQGPVGVFWADQVTDRVTDIGFNTFFQFNIIVVATILLFVPWTLPVLLTDPLGLPKVFTPRGDHPLLVSRYILCWTAVYAVLAALVVKLSTRYLLVVTPLLAVLLADALVRLDARTTRCWLRMGIRLLAVTTVVVGAVVLRADAQLSADYLGILMALVLIAGALAMAATAMRGARLRLAMCLGATMLMLYPLTFLGLRHFAVPDQGQQLATRLAELTTAAPSRPAAHLLGKPSLASKIRVCSGGTLLVSSDFSAQPKSLPVLVISDDVLEELDQDAFDISTGSQGFKDLAPQHVAKSLLQGTLAEYLKSRRQHYHIAVRADRTSSVRYAEQPQSLVR